MNRGSEWRKWDLHIHTPETAKNNQFGDPQIAWPKYIQTLEKPDISVFGITDYFSEKNRHKAQRKAKFYINKCRSASCMQGGLKQASA